MFFRNVAVKKRREIRQDLDMHPALPLTFHWRKSGHMLNKCGWSWGASWLLNPGYAEKGAR